MFSFNKQSNVELKLIASVVNLTALKAITWTQSEGDCYQTECRTCRLDWIYWYNENGITIGRQALVLHVDDYHLPMFWGTDRFEFGSRILSEVDVRWKGYFRTIATNCREILMYDIESENLWQTDCVRMIRRLREASKMGRVKWSRVSDKAFTGKIEELSFEIGYVQPADYDDAPLSNLILELSFHRCNMEFVCGTEGYIEIEKLLGNQFPEIDQRLRQNRDSLYSALQLLERISK